MTRTTARRLTGVALSAVLGIALAACGGGNIQNAPTQSGGSGGAGAECGKFNMAINPWVGYEASAHVVGYVAKSKLGCDVEYKNVKEEVAWQGMGNGEVDTVIENWGHPDLVQKYIDEQKTAADAGPNGNIGIIGWYVPPWMAQQYPDITDWNNLNKYADMFKTTESGGKGQLLDGDPSFVTNDEALVKNLNLNYQVVYAGSEAALIQAFRQAETNKTPLLGYFYEPQWFMSEVKLVKVNLPPYTEGCDADPAKIACDYPTYDLNKIVAAKFAESNSPAYNLVKSFRWTNEDQNAVAKMIAEDGMDPEAAAEKWVNENAAKADAWLNTP
ncbi:MAG TPA: ABC transporter substrate-binding protein [Propionibacteriaceae bacterium]|nr:ABC transporter substrate-binding protein [Propionibacteriaceae bacterium]